MISRLFEGRQHQHTLLHFGQTESGDS
uniref:Uncharacterized protein n=1 Tax=Anguilla anguilla TaxID=7936 RepID=A0A0E9W2B9_ANGAN